MSVIITLLILVATHSWHGAQQTRVDDVRLANAQKAREAGQFAEAIQLVDEPPHQTLRDKFDAALTLLREAEYLEAKGDEAGAQAAYRDAARRLDEVLAAKPRFVEARNNRALAYFKIGRREEAYADLTQVIAVAPAADQALYRRNLGDLYARGDRPRDAAPQYAAVLTGLPYDASTLHSLLDLGLEHTPDGAAEMLRIARQTTGPLASAAPLRVLSAATARDIQDTALLDLTRDFAARLPYEPLEAFREQIATMPESWSTERDDLARLMSNPPRPAHYEWWRQEGRRPAFAALLMGRASRALADDQAILAAMLAEEATHWTAPGDLVAGRQAIDFAFAAGDDARVLRIVDAVLAARAETIPENGDGYQFHRSAGIALAQSTRWDGCPPAHGARDHLLAADRIEGNLPERPSLRAFLNGAPPASSDRCDPPTVYFDSTQSQLDAEGKAALLKLIGQIQGTSARVRIVGHTDDVDSEETNLDLSFRRAGEVKQFLLDNGLAAEQVTESYGRGEYAPVADNATEAGRKLNRRAVVYVQ